MLGKLGKKARLSIIAATSFAVAAAFLVHSTLPVIAVGQANSQDYSVDEAYFGTGGDLGDCSGTGANAGNAYCARMSTGDLATGPAADGSTSNGYQIQAGQNTDRDEYLEVRTQDSQCPVNNTNTNLGYLSPSSTATTSANFTVKAYLAHGYSVYTASDPPKNNGLVPHTFATPNLGAGANPAGVEQFGINLVDNSTPDVGRTRDQLPDSSFSYGEPSTANGYGTPNRFTYNKNDIIAGSSKSSGTTCYYVSYLFNIAGSTPAGEYKFNHDMVVLASY